MASAAAGPIASSASTARRRASGNGSARRRTRSGVAGAEAGPIRESDQAAPARTSPSASPRSALTAGNGLGAGGAERARSACEGAPGVEVAFGPDRGGERGDGLPRVEVRRELAKDGRRGRAGAREPGLKATTGGKAPRPSRALLRAGAQGCRPPGETPYSPRRPPGAPRRARPGSRGGRSPPRTPSECAPRRRRRGRPPGRSPRAPERTGGRRDVPAPTRESRRSSAGRAVAATTAPSVPFGRLSRRT